MSKAREASLKRRISRGTKNRVSHFQAIKLKNGEEMMKPVMKEPRIITEFVNTIGKLIILKRSTTGANAKKTTDRGTMKNQRPYYSVVGTV